ncbi:hypothetical protein QJQ45_023305, partial [Haematococcus lacustris]
GSKYACLGYGLLRDQPPKAQQQQPTAHQVLYLAAILDPRYKMLHFQFSPAQFSQAEQVLSGWSLLMAAK